MLTISVGDCIFAASKFKLSQTPSKSSATSNKQKKIIEAYYDNRMAATDLKIDLADGCKQAIDLLGQQLENGNCTTIVRVELGYFHSHSHNGPAGPVIDARATRISDEEMIVVFQGIVCCLPNLKTLVVMSYFQNEAMSLPIAALDTLFRRAHYLEILLLHQVQLIGNANDIAESLSQHASLKRVNIHCCSSAAPAAVDDHDNLPEATLLSSTTNLDPLVCSLAQLPTMYYLSLDHVPITQASMQALANSHSLRDISLYNMPEIQLCLSILLDALQNGKNIETDESSSAPKCQLKGLRLRSCNLGHLEANLITNMLAQNTSLESVVFYIGSPWEDYGSSLATALKKNTTLKRLEVGIGGKTRLETSTSTGSISPAIKVVNEVENGTTQAVNKQQLAAQHIAKALEVNKLTSLKHFALWLCGGDATHNNAIYNSYVAPFAEMLESNYVLESFLLNGSNSFGTNSTTSSERLQFLLSLNHDEVLGRNKLFQHVRNHDKSIKAAMHAQMGSSSSKQPIIKNPWVDSVIENKDGDLSLLYYLLRRNPNLIASTVSRR